MKVVVTDAAFADMLEIGNAIAKDSPHRAETFIDELHERCRMLETMPEAYPLLTGYEEAGIRRRLHGNYMIFYRIARGEVEVLRVFHGARDYEQVLSGND